jgi:O-antigen ligase
VIATLGMAWVVPEALPFLPLVPLAALAFAALTRRPLLHLCVALGGLVLVFDYREGLQLSEVVGTAYYVSYLAGWFLYHVALERERLLREPVDYAVALLLVFVTASVGLTLVFGGNLFDALNGWRRFIILAFYFPVKTAIVRDPRALRALLLTFALVVLVVAVRNLFTYYTALQSADALWQIMTNRMRRNERLLMMGFLGALLFLLYYARTRTGQFLLFLLSVMMLSGVVAGLSRALWVSAALGIAVAFFLVGRADKLRLITFVSAGTGLLILAAMIFLDDFFGLVVEGLSARFATLETATSRDISLINRFYEWRTAWEYIVQNPIVGYGFGVPYRFYSAIYYVTESKTFVHNSYLSLLYRHGLIGLSLFGFVAIVTFVRSVRLALRPTSRLAYAVALACAAAFPALALAATTEDIFFPADGMFSVTFPVAVIAALWEREWQPRVLR